MIQGDRELIDAYLQGSMIPAERLLFETRLQTDTVLKKETDAVLLVLPLIHEAGRMSLKTKLRAIEATLPASFEDYSPAKNNKGKLKAKGEFSLKWWWIAVAAGMIAAAVTWYVFFYHANHEGHHESPDHTEQPVPAQPATNNAELRRIADSIYADSCRKDSLPNSTAVPSDTASADTKQGGSKPKPAEGQTLPYYSSISETPQIGRSKTPAVPAQGFTIIDAVEGVPQYTFASTIYDKTIITARGGSGKKPVVVDVENASTNVFHYRFTNDTLTLYGPFLRNLLYYDQSGDKFVLHYKEKYYPLPPTAKIKPLVEDPELEIPRSSQK